MASQQSLCLAVDDSFGPYAGACRGGFDFTLFFEETIFSIGPLALLILVAPLHIISCFKKSRKVVQKSWFWPKLAFYALYSVLNVVLIALWAKSSTKTSASIAASVIKVVGTLVLCLLSYAEHIHSVRPSSLLIGYFILTPLLDVAHTRTLWLRGYDNAIAALSTVALVAKLGILGLELANKRRLLLPEYSGYPSEATSGILNRSLFWWLNELLRKGYKKVLFVQDLFVLDKQLTSDYLQKVIGPAWTSAKHDDPHALFKSVTWSLRWPLLAVVPPRLCLIGFNFCQPFLISRAIALSQAPVTPHTTNIGCGLIGAYVLVYMGIAITTGQYQHFTYRAITMARGGLVSLLYGKATDLGIVAVDPAASLTLMSADIERITTGWQTMHEIWANLVEIAIAIYLLEQQLGAACAVPIAVAIIALAGSLVVTSMVMSRQALWLEAIERRVAATTSMLGAMKGVKMWGLTDLLFSSIHQLRVDEINVSKGFRRLLIWNLAFSYVTPVIAPILTFAVFSLIARAKDGGTSLDINRVFTSLSLFALLTEPLGSFIMAIATFMGAIGCFSRIQDFLTKDGHSDYRKFSSHHIRDDTASSTNDHSLGGKSLMAGQDAVQEKISVSSDEKGIDAGISTSDAIVVQNGVFGWVKDQGPILSSIDMTIPKAKFTMLIGPVGCGKSTLLKGLLGELPVAQGQIQVFTGSIAYCDQTPWHMNGTIRDSIIGFSPVDETWYTTVVRACELEADFRQLVRGDRTEIGSKGIVLSGGQSQRVALARAVYAQRELLILDDVFSGLDVDTENRIFHNLLGQSGLLRRQNATIFFVSSAMKRVPYTDHIIAMGLKGQITEFGTFTDLNQKGGYVSGLNLPQPIWTAYNKDRTVKDDIDDVELTKSQEPTETEKRLKAMEEDTERQSGDLSIYLYYIRSIGWLPSLIFAVAITGFSFSISFPNLWVKWWATANEEQPNQKLGFYLGIYAMLGIIALICLILSCWQMIITMVPLSGVRFHWSLLKSVLSAPVLFFATTDTGITINRFSQDLQLIDMELPIAALNTFATFVLVIANMILIGISSIYAAISFPICIVALYFIQRFYLRTSRQLRFLDIEAKAPLYTQFVECLSGLATIRAFGWRGSLLAKNREMLDYSQRPFYLLFAVQRWLTLVLDFMVAGIATLLIILVVRLRGTISSGYVGVALVNIIVFSQSVKMLLTFWTQLETHIGAIARVKSFTIETEDENKPEESETPPPLWPRRGAIRYKNVTASYGTNEPILKDIQLNIDAGEKIALCGRTGSGKSSLVASLFRMIELNSGSITVDGLDISTIPRQEVRSRLIGVPQDPYLIAGTVRTNADSMSANTDESIIEALKGVKLWDIIESRGGLDVDIEVVHLSHGQRQLFCLARAMLRESRILVLDEATSVVDNETDNLMQDVIREKFHNHTIIAIAHKLDTILDYDKVAVLDAGRVVEFASPHDLLNNPSSMFSQLYNGLQKSEEEKEDQ